MNIQQIMQQAQVMKQKMAELQARLGNMVVTGEAGGGLVSIVMTCKGYADMVRIKPAAIDPADPSVLEDLVKVAINDGRRQADQLMADETRKMMEGMGLPGNFQLPF